MLFNSGSLSAVMLEIMSDLTFSSDSTITAELSLSFVGRLCGRFASCWETCSWVSDICFDRVASMGQQYGLINIPKRKRKILCYCLWLGWCDWYSFMPLCANVSQTAQWIYHVPAGSTWKFRIMWQLLSWVFMFSNLYQVVNLYCMIS